MLVYTQGGANYLYTAYLLTSTSGSYSSPFFNTGNGNQVGYLTLRAYVTPLPGALPLYGTVVGLVALMRWRKRRMATA
jgi:hypothetical protein